MMTPSTERHCSKPDVFLKIYELVIIIFIIFIKERKFAFLKKYKASNASELTAKWQLAVTTKKELLQQLLSNEMAFLIEK